MTEISAASRAAARTELDRLWARGRDFLGSEVAILAGAMSWVSERHLVSAISNAGGFGVIACGSMGPDLLAAEIARCEKDEATRLKLLPSANPAKKQKGARYTPVAKRNDRPDGIAYLLRNYPQLTDTQIGKMMGTTKDTIDKVRSRTHWNSSNIKPRDPVILGLCTQSDLHQMVMAANDRLTREGLAVPAPPPPEADEAA